MQVVQDFKNHEGQGDENSGAGGLALGAPERRVVSFYEHSFPGGRGLLGNAVAKTLHLGFWNGRTRGHRESITEANRALAARAAVKPGDLILDAGCGSGRVAVWLARRLGVRVVGVDLSPGHVYRARRLANREGVGNRTTFERRDFCRTGLPAGSFDVVWASESVCHVRETADFLVEAYRLLKPGGRLVMADFIRTAAETGPGEESLMRRWLDGWALPELSTGGEISRKAREVGFAGITLEDATADVWPSVRRLRRRALLGYPVARTLHTLKVYPPDRLAAVRSGFLQFEALGLGLWSYVVFTATKEEV